MKPTDEQIVAWLDGALSDADKVSFEAAMEADPVLAEQVLRWQNNDGLLKAAIPEEPVSDALLAGLGLAPESVEATVINLADVRAALDEKRAAKASLFNRLRWPAMGALAASVAAAVVLLPQLRGDAPVGLEGSKAFQVAMQSNASTQGRKLEDGRLAMPMLSFKAGDGRYCREFHVSGSAGAESGIACRGAERWSVEALVKGGAGPEDQGEVRTAAGANGSSLDATYEKLNASDPMAAVEERDQIAKAWKK
jgi:hypothetical protein